MKLNQKTGPYQLRIYLCCCLHVQHWALFLCCSSTTRYVAGNQIEQFLNLLVCCVGSRKETLPPSLSSRDVNQLRDFKALGRLLCEFLKLFQCWGKPWYAVFIFLCVKTTKQQHHVISCMFPEPEIPALLQAALLIKPMWFVRLVSDSLSSLTAAVGKRTGLLRRCSESCKLVTQRRWTPASPRGLSSSIWCFCAFAGLRKVEREPAQQIYRTARW